MLVAVGVASSMADAALGAQGAAVTDGLQPFGVPVEFFLFALTLLGVALFHRYTLQAALLGLAAIVAYKLAFTGFKDASGLSGSRSCTCSTSGSFSPTCSPC